jgi:hypothetical protein
MRTIIVPGVVALLAISASGAKAAPVKRCRGTLPAGASAFVYGSVSAVAAGDIIARNVSCPAARKFILRAVKVTPRSSFRVAGYSCRITSSGEEQGGCATASRGRVVLWKSGA